MLTAPSMASEPTAPRDVRPVVAAGLCLVAVILAWPLWRDRDGDPATPVGSGERIAARPAIAPAETEERIAARPAVAERERAAPPPKVAAVTAASKRVARKPLAAAEAEKAATEPKTGIGVFPPPGTDPPKTGIIVPDDYVLPPGYVRHFQTTDDGKQLPPILMFHPDFQPVDDRGEPIALPADRVVPPELAPPGLPPDMLDVPPTRVPLVEDPPR